MPATSDGSMRTSCTSTRSGSLPQTAINCCSQRGVHLQDHADRQAFVARAELIEVEWRRRASIAAGSAAAAGSGPAAGSPPTPPPTTIGWPLSSRYRQESKKPCSSAGDIAAPPPIPPPIATFHSAAPLHRHWPATARSCRPAARRACRRGLRRPCPLHPARRPQWPAAP